MMQLTEANFEEVVLKAVNMDKLEIYKLLTIQQLHLKINYLLKVYHVC